jgi:hypothetical protein
MASILELCWFYFLYISGLLILLVIYCEVLFTYSLIYEHLAVFYPLVLPA